MSIEAVVAAAGVGKPANHRPYPDNTALVAAVIARQLPGLIDAFRRSVLHPRRSVGRALIERGQQRGDLPRDIDPEAALDRFAGPFLARVLAGLDTGPRWRGPAFAAWWDLKEGRPR